MKLHIDFLRASMLKLLHKTRRATCVKTVRENDVSKLNYKWLNNVWVSKSAILCVNALIAPFALPLIAWIVICACYSALLSASQAVGGGIILTALGLLPCALIYAVGLAGGVYSYKCMLVDGDMSVRKTFARGIRKNAGRYILFVFIMWLSSALAAITPTLYSFMGNSLLYGVGLAVSIFQLLIAAPAMCLCMLQCAYYEDKLRYCFSNAFKLYFMRPLRSTGVTLLCALPFLLCVILPFVVQLVFWALFVVIGVSIGIIFFLRYAKGVFDGVTERIAQTEDICVLGADDAPAPAALPVTEAGELANQKSK